MYDNPVDSFGSFQPHQLPGFTSIHTFVNTGAAVVRIARIALARARPDDIGIARCNRHCTNTLHRLIVEDRLPVNTAVYGFPDAAGSRADVQNIGIARIGINRIDPPAHASRAKAARCQPFELFHIYLLPDCLCEKGD